MPLRLQGGGKAGQAMIREPGDLPETVVPQPGGVYRNAACLPQSCGGLSP